MKPLLVATTNAGKVAELRPLLAELGWEPRGLEPSVPVAVEDGSSFADNARDKALHYARHTGMDVLADDSGLEVAALDGQPGVHSARFAGEGASDADNNTLLLERLGAEDDRRARFVCALCLVEAGQVSLEVQGQCPGRILREPRGSGGFGYDPLFVPDEGAGEASFGQLSRQQKLDLSHRGRALAALAGQIKARQGSSASS